MPLKLVKRLAKRASFPRFFVGSRRTKTPHMTHTNAEESGTSFRKGTDTPQASTPIDRDMSEEELTQLFRNAWNRQIKPLWTLNEGFEEAIRMEKKRQESMIRPPPPERAGHEYRVAVRVAHKYKRKEGLMIITIQHRPQMEGEAVYPFPSPMMASVSYVEKNVLGEVEKVAPKVLKHSIYRQETDEGDPNWPYPGGYITFLLLEHLGPSIKPPNVLQRDLQCQDALKEMLRSCIEQDVLPDVSPLDLVFTTYPSQGTVSIAGSIPTEIAAGNTHDMVHARPNDGWLDVPAKVSRTSEPTELQNEAAHGSKNTREIGHVVGTKRTFDDSNANTASSQVDETSANGPATEGDSDATRNLPIRTSHERSNTAGRFNSAARQTIAREPNEFHPAGLRLLQCRLRRLDSSQPLLTQSMRERCLKQLDDGTLVEQWLNKLDSIGHIE